LAPLLAVYSPTLSGKLAGRVPRTSRDAADWLTTAAARSQIFRPELQESMLVSADTTIPESEYRCVFGFLAARVTNY
jgi:hypothetical protein